MGTDNQDSWKWPVTDFESLLIVGASARAAAFSALRAGLRPWCVDLFADADLRSRCPVQTIASERYPHGLIEYFRKAPPGPWMYTGALENHPEVVERLSRERPLLGNPAEVLRRVRSPMEVARVLKAAGLPCPEARRSAVDLPANKRWLIKPLAGAGGVGIGFWNGANANRQRVYFHEFIEGTACSAVFHAFCFPGQISDSHSSPSPPASGREGLGEGGEHAAREPQPPHPRPLSPEAEKRGEKGLVQLLGVTQQLIGEIWLNAKPFRWCGNIGPMLISLSLRKQLQILGEVLVQEFGLRGLFGVDFILHNDCPWPVEINPRYTGAVEVLEYACGESFLGEPSPVRGRRLGLAMVGKAILFAEQDFRFPDEGPWTEVLRCPPAIDDLPAFADIPTQGSLIEIGQPVLTIFSRGNTVDHCREQLQMIVQEVQKFLLP